MKLLVIGLLNQRLMYSSRLYDGSVHDYTIFKEVFSTIELKKYRVHVDAGFIGIRDFIDCKHVFIPHKATRNNPLTKLQKTVNAVLAGHRVCIENSIARMKAYFVLRVENRMRDKSKLQDAVQLCLGLANFKNRSIPAI